MPFGTVPLPPNMSPSDSLLYSQNLLGPMLKVFFLMLLVGIALYIYSSFALRTISKKTNIPDEWTDLAWVPFGNLYLMTQIARIQWWLMFVPLLFVYLMCLMFINPMIGIIGIILALLSMLIWLGLYVWMWWRICQARNKPGWWSLLIMPIPGLIIGMILGIIMPLLLMLITATSLILMFVMMGVVAWKD